MKSYSVRVCIWGISGIRHLHPVQLFPLHSIFLFYHFSFLTFIFELFITLFIQWLRLKVAFFNSQSQPLRAIISSAIPRSQS